MKEETVKPIHISLEEAINNIENCYIEAPVDFVGTGGGKSAKREEKEWRTKFEQSINVVRDWQKKLTVVSSGGLDEAAERHASANFPNKSSWEYHTEYKSFLAGGEWQKNRTAIPSLMFLFHIIDVAWNHCTESKEVPSKSVAEKILLEAKNSYK